MSRASTPSRSVSSTSSVGNNNKAFVTKSESMAYPAPNTSDLLAKASHVVRHNSKAVLATLGFFVVLLVLSSDALHDYRVERLTGRGSLRGSSSSTALVHWGGAIHPGYFDLADATQGDEIHFCAVTDMDELSRVNPDSSKPKFKSLFLPGKLTKLPGGTYEISLQEDMTRTLTTKHNEAGRGAEFSELTVYNNRLLTFDDRTGDVFEILNNADGTDSFVVPRFVVTEGDGDTDKGMKWEWATVKDGQLVMGSMGKEYTRKDGSIKNRNNLWVGMLNGSGELSRADWTAQYDVVRKALGAERPGYFIIEAVNWSPALRKWVFLPRRISSEAYDDVKDEKRGGRKLVLVDEDFSSAQVIDIQLQSSDPLKGFSSFAFVPGTADRHILAARSVEEDCVGGDENTCKQRTYFVVFDTLTGEPLSEEIMASELTKFEGLEFVNMFTRPPVYH